MSDPAPRLLVGIGNVLMGDDGAGVRALEALRALEARGGDFLPDGVELLEGGTLGIDLVDAFRGRRKVVVLDAVEGDGPPGTIYRLGRHDLAVGGGAFFSLHDFGVAEALRLAEALGEAPDDLVVIGVQPGRIGPGLELSPEVAEAIPGVVRTALAELNL